MHTTAPSFAISGSGISLDSEFVINSNTSGRTASAALAAVPPAKENKHVKLLTITYACLPISLSLSHSLFLSPPVFDVFHK